MTPPAEPRVLHAPPIAAAAARATPPWMGEALARAEVPALMLAGDGRVVEANPGACALFGLPIQALAGRALDDLLSPSSAAEVRAGLVARAGGAREPTLRVLELEVRPRSGRVRHVEAAVLPAREPGRWVAVLWNDHERRRGEAELRYKKALLESQNEASVDGILIVDSQSRVVSVNRRFLEMWGLPEGLLRVGGSDEEALVSVLDRLADREGFVRTIEWLFDHPDARTRDEVVFKDGRVFERWSTPVHGADGTYYGRGWYFRDVTQRRQQEAELRAAYERLREGEEFRTQLLHNICHDLGTPLTPINVQLHLLEHTLGPLSEAQVRALRLVRRNMGHLQRLVEDLRDVGRLQADKLKLQLQDVRLDELAVQAAESFRVVADERSIALRAEGHGPLVVRADPHRLTQVLFNLVSNALKFTPPGGSVEVGARAEGQEAVVRVRDAGRGLAPEEIPRLFRPFSQVHEPREAAERGSGLGLFISKGLVEQHGGRVWAESPGRGEGSVFGFALPLMAAGGNGGDDSEAAEPHLSEASSAPKGLAGP